MKNTLKKYRLHIQELETEAAEKVDQAFEKITLDKEEMNKSTLKLIKSIVPEIKKSIKEGYRFGTYIKKLSKRS